MLYLWIFENDMSEIVGNWDMILEMILEAKVCLLSTADSSAKGLLSWENASDI